MRKPLAERFWEKVEVGPADSCWCWEGGKNPLGYGKLNIRHVGWRLAHRVAWELTCGVIPDGLCVLHSCDNPPCCNPSHLRLGTRRDNSNDKVARHRQSYIRGEKCTNAKLTEKQVLEIRRVYATGGIKQIELARRLGVGKTLIGYIVNHKAWKHLLPATKETFA